MVFTGFGCRRRSRLWIARPIVMPTGLDAKRGWKRGAEQREGESRLGGGEQGRLVCHALQVLTGRTTELSDAGGPSRPNRQLTWPARVRSSDLVSQFDFTFQRVMPL
jgi:hypothetical protein